MQIYYMKMPLSSLFVKFFYTIFSARIKLFNYQGVETYYFFEKFSLYLRGNINNHRRRRKII